MYQCPECKRIYRKNGLWLRKHMIEVCHVKYLRPIELVENSDIDLIVEKVLERLKVKSDIEIRRKSKPMTRLSLKSEKVNFKDVMNELKGVLENGGISTILKPIPNIYL